MIILPITVSAVGIFLLFKLSFFPIIHPVRTARGLFRSVADSGGYRSLSLALAGTLGVGNVFGVAISITVGGAGSILWLLISGVFSAMIKYAEALVSVDRMPRGGKQGGIMHAIESELPCGRVAGRIYASLCLVLALVMGGAMQSSAAVSSARAVFADGGRIFSVSFAIIALLLILSNRERLKSLTAYLIPFAAFCYALICISVIFRYASELPSVLSEIFSNAFRPRSVGGGILGSLVASPVARGYSTGILSNEAGAGTSSMAHASGEVASPVGAGLLGMCEVIFDTSVICTLSAFAILLPYGGSIPDISASELVVSSLSRAFPHSELLLCISVTAFALATVVCWCFYGRVAVRYLFGGDKSGFFMPIYLAAVFVGSFIDCSPLAALSDVLLILLSFLCLPVIIKSSDRIRTLSERDGLI